MTWSTLIHDSLTRFIAQAISIIVVSRLLGLVTRRIGQPMVIAEITAGILLGPSLLGMFWPETGRVLFAPSSLDILGLVSQLGLILFMFLIGLELDPRLLQGRGKSSVAISHTSIAVPFLLGVGLAFHLYPTWSSPKVPKIAFVLFMGAAMSITAFPVLARILSERRLLRTRVGVMAITCAAVDDVTAWCLLAFVVAAARSNGFVAAGVTTVLAVAYILFMFFVVRPLLRRLAARVTTQAGLTQNVVATIISFLLLSSWATELIGIHALFGAFLLGAILPKDGGLAHALAEKLEDLVLVVLLPLFFAYSGVRTQLSLLNDPEAWTVCIGVIFVACLGKFGGSAVAAKWTGLSWRESSTIGVLMNTRGLMELIVLNIGLDLGVLSPTIFAMMVVMALVTTFMTSPILAVIYPAEMQARDALDQAPNSGERVSSTERISPVNDPTREFFRPLVCVANENSGPRLLEMAAHLSGNSPLRVHALHLVPPTERASFYVEEGGGDERDSSLAPLLDRASELDLNVKPISFVSTDPADDICSVAEVREVDLILMGWHKPVLRQSLLSGTVARVLKEATVPVGIFVDRGLVKLRRVLVPFVGTQYDHAALRLVQRLTRSSPELEVTLLHVRPTNEPGRKSGENTEDQKFSEPMGSQVTLRVVHDDRPVDVALAESALDYDLVVVGLGREWGLERRWMGLHSERLLREARTSLLIVGGHFEEAAEATG